MIYAAQSQSLAVLEILVHMDSADILKKYVLFEVEIDDSYIVNVNKRELPRNWKMDPVSGRIQTIGDAWVAAGSSAVVRVPSALIPGESNFLLNPRHVDFQKLTIHKPVPFQFDPRFAR
jgi:RES domain-containing protein